MFGGKTLRSLLSPEPAAEPAAPPDTRSRTTEEPTAPPTTPPPGPAPPDLQTQLYQSVERLALALVSRAERELLKEPKEGEAPVSMRELQSALTTGMDLLQKLPKLKPEEADDSGVNVLREALQDPAGIVERLIANPSFIRALKEKGWLPPPARPHHRPSKAQVEEREAYEERKKQAAPADDDSTLQSMLNGGV